MTGWLSRPGWWVGLIGFAVALCGSDAVVWAQATSAPPAQPAPGSGAEADDDDEWSPEDSDEEVVDDPEDDYYDDGTSDGPDSRPSSGSGPGSAQGSGPGGRPAGAAAGSPSGDPADGSPSTIESRAEALDDLAFPEDPPVAASSRELGARLGITGGGRTTPGGLAVGGSYLYQLSTFDWFEGSVGFVIGGGGAACFLDRDGEQVCDHGALSGRAAEFSAGVRRFLRAQKDFTPYLQAQLGLRVVTFPGDEITGVAALARVGAGVRVRVHDLVSVGGGARLDAGLGYFSDGVGGEPQLGLGIHAGVEFLLD